MSITDLSSFLYNRSHRSNNKVPCHWRKPNKSMSVVWNKLLCPCFDMTWVRFPGKDMISYAMLPGGGGGARTGVKNQIQVMRFAGKSGFELVQSFDADSKLCCAVSSATIADEVILCTAVDKTCILYSLALTSDKKVDFVKKVEFVADFGSDPNSCINCSCIFKSIDNEIILITSGDDAIVRVWNLEIGLAGGNHDKNKDWKISNRCELKGHTGPIMAVCVHPTLPIAATGSRDGSCRVWDVSRLGLLIYCIELSDGTSSTLSTKRLECRGCCFSDDGLALYLIQSGRVGSTHLIKYFFHSKVGEGSIPKFAAEVAVLCNKVPSTRLRVNAASNTLAVGGSDGTVTLFDLDTLKRRSCKQCHEMPVTGLSFCPVRLSESGIDQPDTIFIVSCSADYSLASMNLAPRADWFTLLVRITLVVMAIVALYALYLKYAVSKLFIS
jgi:WD40 repeat protein